MRRKIALAAVAGSMMLVAPSPATAHEGHAGCQAFGQHIAEEAQTFRPFGQLVSQFAPLNEIVAAEHEAICEEPGD
jgi:hypothetical protein